MASSSSVYRYVGGDLRPVRPDRPANPVISHINTQFRALVESDEFPCILAKGAVARKNYWLGFYDTLGDGRSARLTRQDIGRFVSAVPIGDTPETFASFVAVFRTSSFEDEEAFEKALWQHLQLMHDGDAMDWAPGVSNDPDQPTFSYSLAGRSFFVIGLHGAASLVARRFGWTTLVFNAHEQFEALRAVGRFESVRSAIRRRTKSLQGRGIMLLADYGDRSEARQYAGRATPADWRCPFRSKGLRDGH